jgi:hypothetical protein
MSIPDTKFGGAHHVSPPLAPKDVHDVVRDADAVVDLMGRETLSMVAELAETLTVSAHDAGAWDIEAAASNVRRLASGQSPVLLTGAMRALTDAITRTEKQLAA